MQERILLSRKVLFFPNKLGDKSEVGNRKSGPQHSSVAQFQSESEATWSSLYKQLCNGVGV